MYNSLLLFGFSAALAVAPVAPEAGNILFLVCGGFALLAMRRDSLPVLRRPVVWMPLVAIVLIATAYLATSGPQGLIGVLYFAPLLCVWPLVNAANQAEPVDVMSMVAVLALCGAGGAGLVALVEVLSTGAARAGGGVANPIHFADVALLVGFLGVGGVFSGPGRWRLFFLAAPISAIVAVVLSATRGAIVAAAVMVATMFVAAFVARLVSRRTLLAASCAIVLLAAVAFQLGAGSLLGVQRILADISHVMASGLPADSSTAERLQMYEGGLRAFLASPFVGHGPIVFTSVAGELADVQFQGVPHLHSDLADMAASAGILGILAYVLFLAAPVAEILRARRISHYAHKCALIVAVIVGYAVMGLTNAMFGILTVTTLFAVICVIAGALAVPRTDPAIST